MDTFRLLPEWMESEILMSAEDSKATTVVLSFDPY